MPAFLVELRDGPQYLLDAANVFVVFATDAADARQAVAGRVNNDAMDGAVSEATVTEITAATDFAGYEFEIVIPTLGTPIKVASQGDVVGVQGATTNTGGTGYVVSEILTVSGGTAGHAARFRITNVAGGAVTGLELIDPGTYTVDPTLTGAATTASAGGTGCTLDLTMAGVGAFNNFWAEMVDLLNANAAIAGADIDVSSGNLLLTIASGGGGDDLGDQTVQPSFSKNGAAVASLLGTLTHEGSAADALTLAIPASPVAAQVLNALKS